MTSLQQKIYTYISTQVGTGLSVDRNNFESTHRHKNLETDRTPGIILNYKKVEGSRLTRMSVIFPSVQSRYVICRLGESYAFEIVGPASRQKYPGEPAQWTPVVLRISATGAQVLPSPEAHLTWHT